MARKKKGDGFLEEWLKSGKAPNLNDLSRHTIQNDKWDRADYERLLEEIQEFDSERDRFCDVVETGNGMWADLLWDLVKVEPKLEDNGNIRPEYLVNHAVMSEAQGLNERDELRGLGTIGDEVAAAMGVMNMRPDVETLYDRLKKEQEQAKAIGEQMSQIEGLEGEGAGIDAAMEGLDQDSPEAMDFQKRRDLINKQLQELKEKTAKDVQELKKNLDQKRPLMRQSMKEAMNKASGEANSMSNMADAWGIDPGSLHRLPAEERLALAKKMNNPKFKKIADLFGPMKRMMFTEQRRKVNRARDEVYDISKGKDLARVLPMQYANLADPDLEMLFFKDFVEGKLLQYEMRGTEKVARGGIVYAFDGSGSMSGEREMWSKAVGLCLLHLARQQKRSFRAIQFGSSHEIKTYEFLKPEDFTIEQITDFAEFFFGGGTDFMRPLSLALDWLKADNERDGEIKADIVFATDGACGVSDEWMKEWKTEQDRLHFAVWAISIGGSRRDEPLVTIADGRVCEVKQLIGGEDIRDVFGNVGAA